MPLFKVIAEKCLGCSNRDGQFNPFLVRDIFSPGLPKVRYNVREWKFEATDEKDVRRLFKEAQDAGISNVCGYTLQSVEQVIPATVNNT